MFGFIGEKDGKYLIAAQTGKVISIRKVPDEVFSEKILGDGVAIIPSEDDVVSPVDGEIIQIAETGHA
ncbi:MAG: PTS glucose transporter subunit IIA, partial [Clostridia bacterium]|nr:PTS glucose transporter subunit IIA [Clostridia bacterium]